MLNHNLNRTQMGEPYIMAYFFRPKRVRNCRTPSPMVPSIKQIESIIGAADTDPHLHIAHDMILILSETGLRAGELRGLRVSDIDIENNRLSISGGKTEGHYIPLTPRALNALRSLHAQHPNSAFVLGEEARRVLRHMSLTFSKIAGQIGAAGHTVHSLRHLFAKRMGSGGVDRIILARLMGISNPCMTLRDVRANPESE